MRMDIITDELLERLKTSGGGWTRLVLNELGVPWPPPKGWKRKLIGKPVPKGIREMHGETRDDGKPD